MINGINGLPPVVLENVVREVKPNDQDLGQKALTVDGKEKPEASRINDENTGNAKKDILLIGQEEGEKGSEDKQYVDFSKLANIVKTTLGDESYNIQFIKDDESEKMIMQVIDNETQEIVKQFPPELTLKIAKIVAKLLETTGQVTNATV